MHCPMYLSIDCILRILVVLKREGIVFEIMRINLIRNMNLCHYEMQAMEESKFNNNIIYEQAVKDMESSVESYWKCWRNKKKNSKN
ncbi:hypothetical protein C2G38_2108321 [Gigaspora rosea]|uniref:Uncharacterized protein n=1 Tax=Gigaspora rosea TaxID=44941 RepID=A0A397UH96_9GLOM|nr:hypothetical protein C2G38_2108321 [Gigaspora rosea]